VNFIRQYIPQVAIGSPDSVLDRSNREVREITLYHDGLGRLLQTVIKKGSLVSGDTARDLVTAITYDNNGRKVQQYLPFAANDAAGNTAIGSGTFKTNPYQQQVAFYNQLLAGQVGETNVGGTGQNWAYVKIGFEPSALNRTEWQYPEGASWVGAGRGIRTIATFNKTSDSIKKWKMTDVSGDWGTASVVGQYGYGELSKEITIDEGGRESILFKNRKGLTILEKRQLTASIDTGQGSGYIGWQCIYRIYDNFDRIRLIIQPAGVDMLVTANWNINTASGAILQEQCYRFEYDYRGHQIRKWSPGGAEESFIYDYKDRLVLQQNSKMKNSGAMQWRYFIYDALSRQISSGLLTSSMDAYAGNGLATWLDQPFPNLSNYSYEELQVIHYDNYSGMPSGLPTTANAGTYEQAAFSTNGGAPEFAEAWQPTTMTQGMITWTQEKVLGGSEFVNSAMFYDQDSRNIQTITAYPSGGRTRVTTQYNFSGNVIRSCTAHEKSGTTNYDIPLTTTYTYDDLGRTIKMETGFHGQPAQRIYEKKYDALGRLSKKDMGQALGQPSTAPALYPQSFAYNIRGWPLGMNREFARDTGFTTGQFFGYDLAYDQVAGSVNGIGFTYPASQYTGDFAGIIWKSAGDSRVRRYAYTYDRLGRLTAADFGQFSGSSFNLNAGLDFSLSASYDKNGNLLSMNQRGWKPGGIAVIDSLQYTYEPYSNRLKNVIDKANDTATLLADFRTDADYLSSLGGNKTTTATDYSYDENGSLTGDKNKNIQGIQYNFLKLPTAINIPGKGTILYVYDAGGRRLKKIIRDSTGTYPMEKTTTYLGDFTYESVHTNPSQPGDHDDTLTTIQHEEGRIRYNGAASKAIWDYFYKDHLGNTRMVLTNEFKLDVYPTLSWEGASGSPEVNNQNLMWDDFYGNPVDVITKRVSRPGAMGDATTNGDYVQLVRKSSWPVGTTKLLRVMAGDRIHTSVDFFYTATHTENYQANPIAAFISTMAFHLFASSFLSTPQKMQWVTSLNEMNSDAALAAVLNANPHTSGANEAPKAYLHVVAFDEQFRFDPSSTQVIAVPYQPGTVGTISMRGLSAVSIKRNGYVMVYVSNESDGFVYFDNFNLTHERGPLLEEYHYYPYGLTMAAISSKSLNNAPENKYKYNKGSELQHKEFKDGSGLEWYATQFRSLDPQLGRWWQIDPKPDVAISPYASMNNNPIRFNDPLGDTLRVNGSNAAKNEFIKINNQALGGYYRTKISEDGTVSYEKTDKKGKMSKSQNGFYKEISSILNQKENVKIGLVQDDKSVIGGSYAQGKIDVSDVSKWGNNKAMSASTVLAHEIVEQNAKQNEGLRYAPAHVKGVEAERNISGFLRHPTRQESSGGRDAGGHFTGSIGLQFYRQVGAAFGKPIIENTGTTIYISEGNVTKVEEQ
jgi:RHS repeat-associated protein